MKAAFKGQITGEGYGFVYVMSYPGSDKVKIGHALNPVARAKDIGGTLAPEQPIVEAYFWCSERREAVERAAHKIEAATRANGEWFTIPVHRAVTVIQQAAVQVGVALTLAHDRQQYEAQAVAELAVKLAALPSLSDSEVHATYYRQYERVKAINSAVFQFTDPYEIALMQEYVKRSEVTRQAAEARKTVEDAATKVKAEQEAASLSKTQLYAMVHGRYPPVKKYLEPVRWQVLHDEYLRKADAERAERERVEAERNRPLFARFADWCFPS